MFVSYPHYLAQHGTTPARAAIQSRYKLLWHPCDRLEITGDRVTESTILTALLLAPLAVLHAASPEIVRDGKVTFVSSGLHLHAQQPMPVS